MYSILEGFAVCVLLCVSDEESENLLDKPSGKRTTVNSPQALLCMESRRTDNMLISAIIVAY